MHVYTNSTILIYLIKIFNQSIGTYAEQQQKKEFFKSEIRLQPNILRFYNSGGTFIKLPNHDHSVFRSYKYQNSVNTRPYEKGYTLQVYVIGVKFML